MNEIITNAFQQIYNTTFFPADENAQRVIHCAVAAILGLAATGFAASTYAKKRGIQKSDSPPIIRALCILGADPNAVDAHGSPLICSAALIGETEAVKALLACGADPNTRDASGCTPLETAFDWDKIEMDKALLANGADPDTRSSNGYPLLLSAASTNNKKAVKALLASGANPNIKDAGGDAPLCQPSRIPSETIVKALLASGADPNTPASNGDVPLRVALRLRKAGIVKALLGSGANPNIEVMQNKTALEWLEDRAQIGHLTDEETEILQTIEEFIVDQYLLERAQRSALVFCWKQKKGLPQTEANLGNLAADVIRHSFPNPLLAADPQMGIRINRVLERRRSVAEDAAATV